MNASLATSVVIPAYRAAHTIGRAVDSVLAQSHPVCEILVVDDGSPDDIAPALARFGDRVTLLRQANGGAASARNLALDHARGDYIAFLDADDYWEPHKLARHFAVYDQFPDCGLTCSRYYAENPQTGVRKAVRLGIPEQPAPRLLQGEPAFAFSLRVWTGTVVVPRSVLADDRFQSGLEPAEDRDLWLRLVPRAPAHFIDEPLATAVEVANSLSRGNVDRDCGNMLRVVHRHQHLFDRGGLRRWEAHVFGRWAAGHLSSGCARAAVVPAWRRLLRQPVSPQAWWIMAKSLTLAAARRPRDSGRPQPTSAAGAGS